MNKPGRSLLLLVAVGGLLPLAATHWWVFELLTHFRLQYVALAGVAIVAALVLRAWFAALVLAIAAAINMLPLLAYLPTRIELPPGDRIAILNVNVNSSNPNHAEILASISGSAADLVTLLEVTPQLEAALGSLSTEYPHRETLAADGNFGIGLLSRYPLIDVGYFATGETTGIDASVDLPSGVIRVLGIHLLPPVGRQLAMARNQGLDELALYVRDVDDPLVLCGDFNLTPYSPLFTTFVRATDLHDTRIGQGIDISWPAYLPLAGIPIDHCLLRGPLAAESVQRLDPIGSDHYPVKVSLVRQGNP